MATLLLSAAGASLGSGFGGTVLGLSGAVIGRAVGATLGRFIDQRIMGAGAEPVETGRLDRIHLMGSGPGGTIPRMWGRMKLGGQVIWASPFVETRHQSGGGKGMPRPTTVEYTYSVSLAVALCEGVVSSVGRIWADGEELAPGTLDYRLYPGDEEQLPDPAIEADLGLDAAPAYRGTAYVVFENLDLSRFGNRVPQFAFEVTRRAAERESRADLADCVPGVALIPGSGEYALATQKVRFSKGFAQFETANAHSGGPLTDFAVSLGQLSAELPQAKGASLVVSWFGDDLRCVNCQVMPKVEQTDFDGIEMPWRAGGIGRASAQMVPRRQGQSIYGGTPADASVVQAIQALRNAGKDVMFYPFVLMDQLPGNERVDPYQKGVEQPTMPWRGRITTSIAAGLPNSPDQTSQATTEVQSFFGTAQAAQFSVSDGQIHYFGPVQWGYRRFILHYAHLCALAGGVEAFCIGSELRGLTQIRGANGSYPAVQALIQLAADVRGILGPSTKISYAADWSEYFGHHVGDDVTFHLDPLWADQNIDFIGVDNYMPLSDWRDEDGHADAEREGIYNIDYLAENVAGGEYYDWYYDSAEGQSHQLRKPISDGQYNEPWVFRPKDFVNWWSNPHYNRVGGVRATQHSAWVPRSKPIRFTEFGCAALNKATNEPNKFIDGKSSESALPRASSGGADEYIQLQYFRAMARHWKDPANNPQASAYAGRMVEFEKSYAWAWDVRPYPYFPLDQDLWSDSVNYAAGHWLNGRATHVPLDALVADICVEGGASLPETAQLHGLVSGYAVDQTDTSRSMIQPLSQCYSFDAKESEGSLHFISRADAKRRTIDPLTVVLDDDGATSIEKSRLPEAESLTACRLGYAMGDGILEPSAVEISLGHGDVGSVAQADFNLQFTGSQARQIAIRWLMEAQTAQDRLALSLPPSLAMVEAGDVIDLGGVDYRVDRLELTNLREVEAVRVNLGDYKTDLMVDEPSRRSSADDAVPVSVVWADLPRFRVDQLSGPVVAATAKPWSGSVAVWASDQDQNYGAKLTIDAPAVVGVTLNALKPAQAGLWDRGDGLQVRLVSGQLESASAVSVLNGRNLIAIGGDDPNSWEIFGFQDAILLGNGVYELRNRLRGLSGTDPFAEANWPAGSKVVLLSSATPVLPVATELAGLDRHYRTGLASAGYADSDVFHTVQRFDLNIFRPLRVCHLRYSESPTGDLSLTWVRRGREDADSWQGMDVPLGEQSESYLVTFRTASGKVVRQTSVAQPSFHYPSTDILADIGNNCTHLTIAQVSQTYGPGVERRFDLPF